MAMEKKGNANNKNKRARSVSSGSERRAKKAATKTKTTTTAASSPQREGHCLRALRLVHEILFPDRLNPVVVPKDDACSTDPHPIIEAEEEALPSSPVTPPRRVEGEVKRWYGEKTDVVEGYRVRRWYKVRQELAPFVSALIEKYGDIGEKCTLSEGSLVWVMDLLFTVYKKLEAPDLTKLTRGELDSIENQVKDLEAVKMEVGWLRTRLSHVSKAWEHELEVQKLNAVLQELKDVMQQEKDELDNLMRT